MLTPPETYRLADLLHEESKKPTFSRGPGSSRAPEQQPPLIVRTDFQLLDGCLSRLILVGCINRADYACA
jgi:hypothetical protein